MQNTKKTSSVTGSENIFCTSATSTEKLITLQINFKKKKFKKYHYTLNLWRNHHQKESCKRATEASERKWVFQILKIFPYGKKTHGDQINNIIRHVTVNRLYKECVFNSYKLPLLNRNLMWAIYIFSNRHFKKVKVKGEILVTFCLTKCI